jgi:hypothetical protein
MVIYTAITGKYDQLMEHPELDRQGLQCLAFLDAEQPSQTWIVRKLVAICGSNRLNAKYYKVLSHVSVPDVACSLWIDGSIDICPETSVVNLADSFLSGADIAVFAHAQRYCLYQEAAHCIHRRKDDREVIRRQVFRYTQEGVPANRGLAECSILLRRHTKQMREFNELWWKEILAGSVRDQISFPYVAWKTGVRVNYIPGAVWDGSLFRRRDHLNR